MKQHEAAPGIAIVQTGDSAAHGLQQHRVIGCRGIVAVGEIGKQAKEQVGFGIREKSDLEFLDLAVDALHTGKHHWHNDQSRMLGRNPFLKIHFRKRHRRQKGDNQCVDNLNGKFAQGQQCQKSEKSQHPLLRDSRAFGDRERDPGEADGQGGDAAQINARRMAAERADESGSSRRTAAGQTL